MNKTKTLLAFGLLAAALQAAPIYMVTQPGSGACTPTSCQIGVLDPTTGSVTSLVDTRDGNAAGLRLEFFDIAINTVNEIYGVSSAGTLWKIDGASGVAQVVAFSLAGGLPSTRNGLAFGSDGLLYLSGNTGGNPAQSGTIFRTNLATDCTGIAVCNFTAANSTPLAAGSAGDIAFMTIGGTEHLFFAGTDDRIYDLVRSGGDWVLSNVSAAAAALPGFNSYDFKGLAVTDGILYAAVHGFLSNGGEGQGVFPVDTTNLTAGAVLALSGVPVDGFVAGLSGGTEVPETSTMLLSVIGLSLLAFGSRNRKR